MACNRLQRSPRRYNILPDLNASERTGNAIHPPREGARCQCQSRLDRWRVAIGITSGLAIGSVPCLAVSQSGTLGACFSACPSNRHRIDTKTIHPTKKAYAAKRKPLIFMVPEAGIEPARPYERGILSPEGKSIRPHLLIVFPVRNRDRKTAIRANVSAYLQMIAARKNPSSMLKNGIYLTGSYDGGYADFAYSNGSYTPSRLLAPHAGDCIDLTY
ncbi:hypothetical protein PS833_00779 [Pseudomonas fluorescens]|uniref:Uncharacterized protein n=1 Tax=Pseudomonas fluorescens TaxID=294 RepID=A0A5E7AJF1_PSEFL|nr:hypothetical protein PS833_00779 [Pseudomonas fluorescens]